MSIATELTALQGYITSAYNAVQTKGGTIPADKNMANLDDAILSIQSGISVTNGVITQLPAQSGTILANTFVEFVGDSVYGEIDSSSVTAIGAGTDQIANGNLDNSDLLPGSTGYVYLRSAADDQIRNTSSTSTGMGAVTTYKIDTNRALLVNRTYEDGDTIFRLAIATVANGAVTVGSAVSTGWIGGAAYLKDVVVSDDKSAVYVYYQVSSNLQKLTCSVSNSTVTVGSTTTIKSGLYTNTYIGLRKIGSDTLFVVSRMTGDTSYQATAFLESTPASVVKLGATIEAAVNYASSIAIMPVSGGVIVTSASSNTSSSTKKVRMSFLTIANSAITVQNEKWLDYSNLYDGGVGEYGCSAISLPDDAVLLGFWGAGSSYRYTHGTCKLTVANNSIVQSPVIPVKNSGQLTTSTRFQVAALAPDRVGVTYGTAASPSTVALFNEYINPTAIKASETRIDGLTAEDITTTPAGDVWVLNS